MQLDTLKPRTSRLSKKRIARGGKRGKTGGRGTKGQKARAGHRIRPELRDLIKKLPKNRGYSSRIVSDKPVTVAIKTIVENMPKGGLVSPESLLKLGVLRKVSGTLPVVRIVGSGEVSVKLNVRDCYVSAGARASIEKAGGKIK